MDQPRRFDVARLWSTYGVRLMRYGGVTIVSTTVGLSTLAFGLYVLGWTALPSNFLSVLVSTPPAYVLNRHWVWEQGSGDHSVAREIGPFWIMTFVGWIFSSLAVGLADLFTDEELLILLAQVSAFGTLWLVKFAFLEKFLWRHDGDRVTEPV
ncbi:MAG: GtrA family protein [Acidimicrobiales bacterium]